ncbi:MAG: retropepsin-like aspartic protease [Chloroflexota bacterium]
MLHALLLTIAVSFGGTSVQCAVDTGSAITVLSRFQASRVIAKQSLPTVAPLQGVGGQPIAAALYSIPNVATGELSWTDAIFAVLPDESLGSTGCLLGMDLLGRQPVVFDWQSKRVLPFRTGSTLTEIAPLRYVTMAPDASLAAGRDASSNAGVGADPTAVDNPLGGGAADGDVGGA